MEIGYIILYTILSLFGILSLAALFAGIIATILTSATCATCCATGNILGGLTIFGISFQNICTTCQEVDEEARANGPHDYVVS